MGRNSISVCYNRVKCLIENSLGFVDTKRFFSFFVLNIVSSIMVFGELPDLMNCGGFLSLIGLAGFFSFFISLFLYFFKNLPRLQRLLEIVIYSLICILLIVDIFLYINFDIVINETIFSIIEGTNVEESKGFLATYLNGKSIFSIIGVLVGVFILCKLITLAVSYTNRFWVKLLVWALLLFSVIKLSISIYTSIFFGFGGHLAAYSTYTRLTRAFYIYTKTSLETDKIIENLHRFKVTEKNHRCDKVVVIIGESYSKYHSQLYGYNKATTPLLSKRHFDGELYVLSNAVTPINDTERAFRAIYSLGKYNEGVYSDFALFPYIFKQAGFYTANIDNMDLASKTSRVKDSKELSDKMFDYRNTEVSRYDETIVEWLAEAKHITTNQLFVIKLKGSHYSYWETYPESYSYFKADDYLDTELSKDKRGVIATYDNSVLYNDYVVNSIINEFEDDNAVVVYFSDHGEEVYDVRDYMGHGGITPYPEYHYNIPFVVWMSELYKESNPQVVSNIVRNLDKPYTTDYVSHMLLDMAGIKCEQYDPQRSLANDLFE